MKRWRVSAVITIYVKDYEVDASTWQEAVSIADKSRDQIAWSIDREFSAQDVETGITARLILPGGEKCR